MKASNGGMLHTLFDYSHPHLLGGKPPGTPANSRSRTRLGASSKQGTSLQSSASAGGEGDNGDAASMSGVSIGGQGCRRALGSRLPRTLVMHGTADATVPFSQTAAVGAALRTLGVPTIVRYDPGGERYILGEEREAETETKTETRGERERSRGVLVELGMRVLSLVREAMIGLTASCI